MKKKALVVLLVVLILAFCVQLFVAPTVEARPGGSKCCVKWVDGQGRPHILCFPSLPDGKCAVRPQTPNI